MGLLERLRGRPGSLVSAQVEPPAVPVFLLDGQDDLEVVGELAYQAALWRLCGGTVGDRVRRDIVAVLVPEPANPHDANAIAVQIDGQVAGYLSRATAQEYLPGLKHVMSVRGGYVALHCAAFMAKWGKVPLLDTYRQMAIRQQKKKDWAACKWWAERGLALYGQRAAREEAAGDLIKRRNRAVARLEATAIPRRQIQLDGPHRAVMAATPPGGGMPGTGDSDAELEVLICQECSCRSNACESAAANQTLCPPCRTAAKA